MIVRVNIATRVVRVYDNHRDSVFVCHGFYAWEINLPFFLRKEIKLADLESTVDGTSLVVRVTRPWEKDVSIWSSQRLKHYFYPLVASDSYEYIISLYLVRQVSVHVIGNRPD